MSRITKDICAAFDASKLTKGKTGFFERLKRHPIPVKATFRHSLVLTYALPQAVLAPLLPPGLTLDTFKDYGFLAIALVQTKSLRPKFCPTMLGQDFFLSGFRIFTRYKTTDGRTVRGLRILRSDTDRKLMVVAGNCLTHYSYKKAEVTFRDGNRRLEIDIKTPSGEADLSVTAELGDTATSLPEHSPFTDLREARLFAGPLPFTFDYEPESHSIVMIEGLRQTWRPRPIKVNVLHNTFFDRPPFNRVTPILANAFHVENIEYEWRRGVCEPLTV